MLLKIIILILINSSFIFSETENVIKNNNNTQNDQLPEIFSRLYLVPLTNSINNFGINLLKQLEENDKNKNFIFSPLSIVQIFSMILSSAQNETLDELMNTLTFNNEFENPNQVNEVFKLLINEYDQKKLEDEKREIKLSLPSIALYSLDFNIKRSFRKNLKDNYNTLASKVNFTSSEALTSINEFVNKTTNGLIPQLLEKIDKDTKLALVNAFYFKGEWVKQFESNLVKNKIFNNFDKTTSNVKTMFKRDYYNYFEDELSQVILLPYQGNASMTIILPKKNVDFKQVIDKLNSTLIDFYNYQMKEHYIELFLPKFNFNERIDLKQSMNALGVNKIFGPDAKLNGISSFQDLYVSDAIHQAYIDVNEKGTVASAATAIGITTKSFPHNMKKMNIDRPFIFFISDQQNDLNLFMGLIKKL